MKAQQINIGTYSVANIGAGATVFRTNTLKCPTKRQLTSGIPATSATDVTNATTNNASAYSATNWDGKTRCVPKREHPSQPPKGGA